MEKFYSSKPSTYEILPILLQSGKLNEFIEKTIDLNPENRVQMWYSNNNNEERIQLTFENGKELFIKNE